MFGVAAILIVVAFSSILLFKYWSRVYPLFLLSPIPNAHFLAPYTRYWLVWLKGTGREHRIRHEAHERLGPIIQIGPNEVSVNCIENGVQTIYGGGFEKAAWYLNFQNYGHTFMFAIEPNKPHSERKRMLTHVYSKSYIQNSSVLDKIVDTMLSERLLPQIRHWAQSGRSVNIHRENKAVIMDIITAYLFGLGNGTNFIQDTRQKDLLHNFELGLAGLFYIAEIPGITEWARRFGKQLIPVRVFQSFQMMEDLCLKMCEAAKSTLLSEDTNLDTKLGHPTVYAQLRGKLEDAQTPPNILDEIIAAEMLDHVQAGHEGTGITLTFLMCELARNPTSMAKLRKEIATLGTKPSAQSIDSLPFLDALLMETMRLYPGALGPLPRYVPENGANLAGFDIPPGTTVSASVYSLHRNTKVFPNPEEWRPERWIDATTESKKDMMKWFWVFGSGGRMCIGNHLAIRMMKAVIVSVYAAFESVLVPETTFKQVDGLMGAPVGNKVMLGFREIVSSKT